MTDTVKKMALNRKTYKYFTPKISSINAGLSEKEKLEFAYKKFVLADVFQNGMILEAEKPFSVWGLGKGGELLTVTLKKGDSVIEKIAGKIPADNSFRTEFSAVPASFDEYTLEAEANGEKIKIENILFGKVFFAGGQSNMEWKVAWMYNANEFVSESLNKYVRIYQTESHPLDGGQGAEYPLKPQFFGSAGKWLDGSNANDVYAATAIGYVFATEMFKLYGETSPIGIVNTSVGGTYAENWLSREALESDDSLSALAKALGKYIPENDWNMKGEDNFGQMSANYNLKIAPIRYCRFRGIIWYQGENNVTDCNYDFFEKINARLISMFRKTFRMTDGAMIAAMIAPRKYFADETRLGSFFVSQAKLQNSKTLKTGVIAQYDIPVKAVSGLPENEYHPTDKIPLGKRMAAAMYRLEKQTLSGISPQAKTPSYENGELKIPIAYTDRIETIDENRTESGIEVLLNEAWEKVPRGDIAYKDGRIVFKTEKPRVVRYNYTQLQTDGNIRSTDGFPLLPFMYPIKS